MPWQVAQERLRCLECLPVAGGMAWQLPHAGVGAGVGVGVVMTRALAIAWMSVVLSDESEPMPPTLPLMAVCILVAVAPSLLEVASGP